MSKRRLIIIVFVLISGIGFCLHHFYYRKWKIENNLFSLIIIPCIQQQLILWEALPKCCIIFLISGFILLVRATLRCTVSCFIASYLGSLRWWRKRAWIQLFSHAVINFFNFPEFWGDYGTIIIFLFSWKQIVY